MLISVNSFFYRLRYEGTLLFLGWVGTVVLTLIFFSNGACSWRGRSPSLSYMVKVFMKKRVTTCGMELKEYMELHSVLMYAPYTLLLSS